MKEVKKILFAILVLPVFLSCNQLPENEEAESTTAPQEEVIGLVEDVLTKEE